MKREEAIRWLTNEKWKNANNKYKKEWNEAFDMAIEALSAEVVHKPDYSYEADMVRRLKEALSADAADVYKAHEEEHLNIANRIKELQYVIAKTQTIVGKMVESADAEWIFNPKDAIDLMFAKPKCSICGFESSDGGNYCPNCGARMTRTKGSEE